uniref:G-protein coupled receptor family C group 6 member A n=1 Tax=Seriola dumerili TaxID=41447 RepID=A0A3B4UAX0_SERDU
MRHFLSFYIFSLVLLNHVFRATGFDSATAPGDIIIGGLFPIHETFLYVISVFGSHRFNIARLVQSLIMVQAVEDVNTRHELGNLTLGYYILDSCNDVTTALMNTQSFMKRNEQTQPPVLAVVGDYYSEISIAVTRHLHLEYIPQISYGATSGVLSDKARFPSFMRTVPEDDHQAQAIVEILQNHNWTWVGVVTTDSDYGRYIVEHLQKHAANKNICFAFTSIIPDDLGHKRLNKSISAAVKRITENKNVSVIVSFARPHHMMYIFEHLLKVPEGRGKVWVASDIWSETADVVKNHNLSDIGTIFGTTLKSGNSTRLKQYLTVLMKKIYPYAVFSVELAVRAIAQAVADLCVNRDCKTNERLDPVELREALRKATFLMHGKNYSFDSKGDLNSGYDIILWRQTSPTFVDVHYVVAHYSIENESLTFDTFSCQGDVVSRCSESCRPGQMKQSIPGMPVCCYECQPCPENYFSNTNSPQCYECNKNTDYSSKERDKCLRKKTVFFYWTDVYHHVLQAFTALGALLTIVVGIIFLARWNTPVVRASVGPICIILLLSLLSTFVSVILFGGEPNNKQCQARQVLFGLSFTMCVSCIMVKSFKIILAFEFDPSVKRVLKKLYKPYIIIAVCMAGQVLICALWLSLGPPVREWKELSKKDERLLICSEKSFSAFGAMLGYIGVLALICFGVAFKGRKLPESYNDAKFITFAMLIYFICWIIFGPVYVNVIGRYHPAVEMVVILISAYGILFCQFFVKCYIILFKQNANTEAAFRQDVRNYSLSQIKDEAGNWVLTPSSSGGIQNTAVDVESQISMTTKVTNYLIIYYSKGESLECYEK